MCGMNENTHDAKQWRSRPKHSYKPRYRESWLSWTNGERCSTHFIDNFVSGPKFTEPPRHLWNCFKEWLCARWESAGVMTLTLFRQPTAVENTHGKQHWLLWNMMQTWECVHDFEDFEKTCRCCNYLLISDMTYNFHLRCTFRNKALKSDKHYYFFLSASYIKSILNFCI